MNFLSWLASGAVSGLIAPFTKLGEMWIKKSADKDKLNTQFDMSVVHEHAEILKQKWMIALQALFAIPLAFYYGKIHVWDAALHLGTSDAIKGDVAQWDMWIMAFLFFHSLLLRGK
jgi:hypothetical protein